MKSKKKVFITFKVVAIIMVIGFIMIACNDDGNVSCAHSWIWVETTIPTCTSNGQETMKCTMCNLTEGTRSISAYGHDENGNEATCIEEKVCARIECDYILTPVLWHITPMGIEPTCINIGNTGTGKCIRENCDEILHGDEIPELGHDTTGVAATCTTAKICARNNCDHVLTDVLGHDTTGAVATCTTAKICARNNCDHVLTEVLGHDTTGAAATCTAAKICARLSCDHVIANANGHTFTQWHETKSKTCYTEGIETEKCSVCNTLGTKTQLIPSHTYINGYCALCHTVNISDVYFDTTSSSRITSTITNSLQNSDSVNIIGSRTLLTTDTGTITINVPLDKSIIWTANLTDRSFFPSQSNFALITFNGNGTLDIIGGEIIGRNQVTIRGNSTGLIKISGTAQITGGETTILLAIPTTGDNTNTRLIMTGGEIRNGSITATNNAIHNQSTGEIRIEGGEIMAGGTGGMGASGGGVAIKNSSTGLINISQSLGITTLINSWNTNPDMGTIVLEASTSDNTNVRLVMTGGRVFYGGSSRASAITNFSTGEVRIEGGTVDAAEQNSTNAGFAIRSASTGIIRISQLTSTHTLIKSANSAQGTIVLSKPSSDNTNTRLIMTGGSVENTRGSGIYNLSTGSVQISGGTVAHTGFIFSSNSVAIRNASTGSINISQPSSTSTLISSAVFDNGTIWLEGAGNLTITGGRVINERGSPYRAVFNTNNTSVVTISSGVVSPSYSQ